MNNRLLFALPLAAVLAFPALAQTTTPTSDQSQPAATQSTSTDTAATLRALEIKADIIAKGTRVDGVYDKDPLKFSDAVRYTDVTYLEVLSKGLGVMDATSIAMCRDNKLPIIVFNLNATGNIMRMSMGEPVGTVIH